MYKRQGLDEAAQKIVFTREELSRNQGKPCYLLELDVYKRQVLLDELGVFVINACQSAAGGCIEHHKMIGIRTDGGFLLRHAFVCIDPVSYTHLDVYTRQVWG